MADPYRSRRWSGHQDYPQPQAKKCARKGPSGVRTFDNGKKSIEVANGIAFLRSNFAPARQEWPVFWAKLRLRSKPERPRVRRRTPKQPQWNREFTRYSHAYPAGKKPVLVTSKQPQWNIEFTRLSSGEKTCAGDFICICAWLVAHRIHTVFGCPAGKNLCW